MVDHIVPVSHGGRSIATNCQVLCKHPHDRKTARESAAGKRQTREARSLPSRRGSRVLGSLD
ncbi:HNH endonuclease [Streptomyces sp. NPDC051563]|uniref:HNH endonuclease n=1 Tax=Streptomyces sp. NPDC051563 TaxID=3365659 RepID=UPI0037898022